MNEIINYNLRPLWDALLGIYDVIAKICNENNIRYYLTSGSALGAVRHQGFIPWDDDMDIMMPRPDYERFWQIAAKSLPPHLSIRSHENTPSYRVTFRHVYINDPVVVKEVEHRSHLKIQEGIYVDVFPVDGCPKTSIGRFVFWSKRGLLWAAQGYLLCREGVAERKQGVGSCLRYNVGRVVSMFLHGVKSSADILDYEEIWSKQIPFSDSGYTAFVMEGVGRLAYPPGTWGEPALLPFEGRMVPVPHDYNGFLSLMYGDYMKLPPEEKRVLRHN